MNPLAATSSRHRWRPMTRTLVLGREGSYVVNLEFEAAELKNWIQRYIEDDPREAMRLLVKMLQLAVDSRDKREEPQEKT